MFPMFVCVFYKLFLVYFDMWCKYQSSFMDFILFFHYLVKSAWCFDGPTCGFQDIPADYKLCLPVIHVGHLWYPVKFWVISMFSSFWIILRMMQFMQFNWHDIIFVFLFCCQIHICMSRGDNFPNIHGQLDVNGLSFHILEAPSMFSVCLISMTCLPLYRLSWKMTSCHVIWHSAIFNCWWKGNINRPE